MSATMVEVEGLYRWFDGVKAVDGVSFSIPAGQVVGLIGSNGAGKTTAMRMMATLDVPDRGVIRVDGVDVVDYPERVRQRIGWMPDYFVGYKDTTVSDYLDFFGRACGLKNEELLRRVDDVIAFTELGSLIDRPIDRLSKGQSQRLCLARTLLNDPALLILDEPAAGLDPKARLEFKNLVRILRERGKTILISSHILSELGEMCDSLIFMDRGRVMHHASTETLRRGVTGAAWAVEIVVDGPVAALLDWLASRPGWKLRQENRQGARAEFSSTEPTALAAELRRLVLDGVPVVDFHREEKRLDEAFVEMLRQPNSATPPVNPPSAP